MNTGIEFTMKLSAAYSAVCRPLCHELNLPQTAFDILMFLANNPEYTTARDIVEIRKIKPTSYRSTWTSLSAKVICCARRTQTTAGRPICSAQTKPALSSNRDAPFRTALWTVSWRISMMLPENNSQKASVRWSKIWITC